MKIVFLTDGKSPVPAAKGGAVENLIESLLLENEREHAVDMTVFSVYEKNAYEQSSKYHFTHFKFVKYPKIVAWLDKGVYSFAKNVLKKGNLISYRYIFQRLYVMSKYPQLLLEEDYDRVILVTNSTLFLVMKNAKVREKYKGKVIYYLHNEVRGFFGCEREVADIHSLISISRFVEEAFRKQITSLKNEQCYVLKNCIDTEKFISRNREQIQEYKKKFQITDSDFIVIFAGRLIKEKGALEVIEAVKKCGRSNIKLLIAGSGFYSSDIVDDYFGQLQKASETIQDKIIFTGYVEYCDMPSIYHLGNVAVFPSIWEEPAGMTMVEAVISGVPLITTDSGGITEYIPSDAAIILKRDENLTNHIADSICKIMDDKAFAENLIRKGRKLEKDLNLRNFYRNFLKIIVGM